MDNMNDITLVDLVLRWHAISGGQNPDWFWRQVNLDREEMGLANAPTRLPIMTWINYPLRELYRISFYPGFRNPFFQAVRPDSDLIVDYVLEGGFLTEEQMSRFLPLAVWDRRFDLAEAAESPMEPFSLLPIQIGDFFFSFTNSSLFMLLTLGLVLLQILLVTKKGGGKLVPNAWQSVVELIYDFVLNLVNEQIGGPSANVKQKFFPCILVTFTFLLFCNLQGMIPFSFTVTSHFLITLALSFSLFIGITIVGFQRHGLHFFSFLLPAGVPLPLAPFLVLLELISHCFRALSSGIRLFANMMAGHSLVKILSGFAWTMLFIIHFFYFIGNLGPLFRYIPKNALDSRISLGLF